MTGLTLAGADQGGWTHQEQHVPHGDSSKEARFELLFTSACDCFQLSGKMAGFGGC